MRAQCPRIDAAGRRRAAPSAGRIGPVAGGPGRQRVGRGLKGSAQSAWPRPEASESHRQPGPGRRPRAPACACARAFQHTLAPETGPAFHGMGHPPRAASPARRRARTRTPRPSRAPATAQVRLSRALAGPARIATAGGDVQAPASPRRSRTRPSQPRSATPAGAREVPWPRTRAHGGGFPPGPARARAPPLRSARETEVRGEDRGPAGCVNELSPMGNLGH
jgi:hypothetical protein